MDLPNEFNVAQKFKLTRRIGGGSFGEIYLGISLTTGDEVAAKLESASVERPMLGHEARIYKTLAGGIGIPTCRFFGQERDFNVLIIDLLGPSLENLFNFCDRRFSTKTVCMLADQMIARLEFMHSHSLLHRDIKPDNFLMGIGKNANRLYMIDFGLSKKYREGRSNKHIPMRDDKKMIGTPRYASINAHIGYEQGRRDDMEAIGYVLLYFIRGSLPWQGVKGNTREQKFERIKEKKLRTSITGITDGLPVEFYSYMIYCKNLKFEETPDYFYLGQLFRNLLKNNKEKYDFVYDWTLLQRKSSAK